MVQKDKVKGGKYLYAVVPAGGEKTLSLSGLEGNPVYAISQGQVAAVVSDLPNGKVRPERRHLAAQQEVLKGLLASAGAVLPMSFGIVADSAKAIQKILSRHQETIVKQLKRVAGKVEMGLRVTWDVPNIFDYFVNTHQELRQARDRFLGPHRNPSQEDKIELGRMFDRLLNDDRESHTSRVEEILTACSFEIKRNKCRNEQEVMNLACLVGRDRPAQAKFEEGIFAAAGLFDNNYAFDYNGPWAPHNFVDLDLEL